MKNIFVSCLIFLLIVLSGCSKDLNDATEAMIAYQNGNHVKAAKLYSVICERGNAQGCYMIGILNEIGDGIPKNTDKAFELYGKACNGGNVQACYKLGTLYQIGEVIPKNIPQAISYYQKACEAKNYFKSEMESYAACNNLGRLY